MNIDDLTVGQAREIARCFGAISASASTAAKATRFVSSTACTAMNWSRPFSWLGWRKVKVPGHAEAVLKAAQAL